MGRDRELARLARRIDDAARGTGGLVVLRGPAGIGKTTIARWCMEAAADAGGTAFLVAAPGPELEAPVGLWTRLALAASGSAPVPDPLLDGAVEQLHPHARYAAALSLVRSLAPTPVVVVIDDLHRADESSAALLAQLAPALASTGVLVIATWRGRAVADAAGDGDAFAMLEPWADVVALDAFTRDDVSAFVASVATDGAGGWADAVAPVLLDRSRGNPLVLAAIIEELGVAKGARPLADELRERRLDRAVADVFGRRLDAMTASTHEVLDVVAAVGRVVAPALLRDVLDRDPGVDIEHAVVGGVLEVHVDGGVGFVHPALSELVRTRHGGGAPQLRLRIADALRRRGDPDDLPAIAHHLAAAAPLRSPADVRRAATDAAAHSLRAGDHAAAARNFDLALDASADDDAALRDVRIDLLLGCAAAHHVAGHRETAWARAGDAARLAGPERPVRFARAALAFAQDRRYTTDQSAAVQLLHDALAALHRDHPLRREVLASCSMLEMSMPVASELRDTEHMPGLPDGDGGGEATQMVAWNWVHRTDEARAMADEALALARATGDEELVARVAMAWRQTHCAPEFLADRLAVTAHATTHARRPADRIPAAVAAVLDHLEAGRRPSVDRALAELVGLADATGDPGVRWRTGQLTAMLALASGRPDVAERQSVEAFAHGTQAGENGRWVVRGVQATLLSLEVDDDPGATLAFLLANLEELVYPPMRAGALYSLTRDVGPGGANGTSADRDQIERHLPDLVKHVVEDTGREASWLMTAALAADAVAAVGDRALADVLLPVLQPYAARISVDGMGFHCHGCLARPLSRLAALTGDRAQEQLLRDLALERDRSAGLRRWVLDGSVDELAARLSAGELTPGKLRAAVDKIADEATSMGLRRTARRARALLHVGVGTLTARQRDVLLALADGLTYQSASERLGFSHSTIRHEAMRVYAALGAGDRDEAVRIARDLGLVPAPRTD